MKRSSQHIGGRVVPRDDTNESHSDLALPVKSMAGERLSVAEITGTGLAGDRVVQVYDRHGRIATARTFPRLLQLRATLSTDGEPLVDGLPWDSLDVGRRVEAAVGLGARLARFETREA